MYRPININNKEEEIELKAQKYRIYLLGGFGVNIGQFSINFKHKETGVITKCKKCVWPVQTYAFGKRAKRIFIVEIQTEGRYKLVFNNPETIQVRHSNLPISSLFRKPLKNNQIEILISENLNSFPILK